MQDKTTIGVTKDTKFLLMKVRAELKMRNYDEVVRKLIEVWENAKVNNA